MPENQGCCGALHAHNGDSAGGVELAKKLGEELPGVIVTTAGGCAAHLATVLGPRPGARAVRAPGQGRVRADRRADRRRRQRRPAPGPGGDPGLLPPAQRPRGLGGAAGAARGGGRLRVRRRRRLVLRVGRHLLAAAAQGRPPRARPQARRRRGGRGRLPRRGQPGLPAPVADRAGPAQEPDPRGAPRRPAGRRGRRAGAAPGAAAGGAAAAGPAAVGACGCGGCSGCARTPGRRTRTAGAPEGPIERPT